MLALAPAETAPPVRRAGPSFKRECLWCGIGFRASARHGDFCCTGHRKAFNNQRAMRGAELYDLVMALRHDRAIAKSLKVWKLICRLAAIFRDEDMRGRRGRKSWRSAAEVIERRPYLRADLMQKPWLNGDNGGGVQ